MIVSFILMTSMFLLGVILIEENNNQSLLGVNPLTLMSDQDRISPYNIRGVMRIKKNINLRIISWSNTKFSQLAL